MITKLLVSFHSRLGGAGTYAVASAVISCDPTGICSPRGKYSAAAQRYFYRGVSRSNVPAREAAIMKLKHGKTFLGAAQGRLILGKSRLSQR